MESTTETLVQLAMSGSLDQLEEKWLEGLGDDGTDIEAFLETAKALAGVGEKDRACVLLLMLYDDLRKRDRNDEALAVLRAVGEIRANEKTLREKTLDCVRAVFKDQPAIDHLIEKSELSGSRKVPDALAAFEQFTRFRVGTHVYHGTGWGTGRIVDFDPASAELTIDFEEDKGHVIPIDSAREIFEILDEQDLRVYMLSRQDELEALCKDDPAEVIKLVLRARGGKALAAELRNSLRGTVIPEKSWSKWWTKARREAAKDSFIEIQDGTKPVYLLRDKPVSIAEEAAATVERAETLAEAVATARGFVRKAKDSIDQASLFGNIRDRVAAMDEDELLEDPGPSIEALIFLESGPSAVAEELELTPKAFVERWLEWSLDEDDDEEWDEDEEGDGDETAKSESTGTPQAETEDAESDEDSGDDDDYDPRIDLLLQSACELLHGTTIQEYRNRFLTLLPEVLAADEWPEVIPVILCSEGPDLWDLGITTLRKAGHDNIARETIREVFEDPARFADSYIPFARGLLNGKYEDLDEMPTRLQTVRNLLKLHEQVQKRRPPLEPDLLKKTLQRVETLLLDGKSKHLEAALRTTTLPEMTRIFHESEASPYLTREVKSAIQTTVARTHPVLLTSRRKPLWQDDNLYCTSAAIDAKQEEFRILTEVKIPENSRAVGAAASLGDLSENSEYTSALESQRLLTEKAEELREMLDRARPIEQIAIAEGQALPGTRVRLRVEGSQDSVEHVILGPWDAGEDDRVISYLSPLGKSLMGHKAGEEVEAELPTGTKRYTIESIEKIDF